MTKKRLKICIIGAGASGIVSIKNCLDEELIPTCYEKSDDIGGLWNYIETTRKNEATVMESTVVNSCKEMYAFSDFPPPKEWPNFTHHTLVNKYLQMYAEHFNLRKYIRFNTSVSRIEKSDDYEITGKWVVYLNNGSRNVFDALMLCNGHHAERYEPKFVGLRDKFAGRLLHSQDYRNWREFRNKRVLVVGIGNSALDISTELSDYCEKVLLSTRRGCWIWPRIWRQGYPVDASYLSQWKEYIFTKFLPMYYINGQFEHAVNKRMDAVRFGLKPKHRFWKQHPAVNDRLPTCLAQGSVVLKNDVKEFTETGVVFEDSTFETVDVVILCTGYVFGFPYLYSDIIPASNNEIRLYKYVFPPNLPHPTLAVIGLVQPHGPLFPLSELQGRWATGVFSGKFNLPNPVGMENDINKKNQWLSERYYRSQRHTVQVMVVAYANELADLIGAKPNFRKLLFSDPKLTFTSYFGPCTPYIFRLNDSKDKKIVRKNIFEAYQNTVIASKFRKGEPGFKHKWLAIVLNMFCFCINFYFLTLIYTQSGLKNYVNNSMNLFVVSIATIFFTVTYYIINLICILLNTITTDYQPLLS